MALHKFIEEKTEKLIRRIAYETCYKCNNISQNYEPNNINFHRECRGRYTISCSFVSMRYAMRASSLCKRRCCCCCLSYKHKLGELIELRRAQIPVPCSPLYPARPSLTPLPLLPLLTSLIKPKNYAFWSQQSCTCCCWPQLWAALEPHLANSNWLLPGLLAGGGSNWVLRVVTLHRNGSKLNCH